MMKTIGHNVDPTCFHHCKISKSIPLLKHFNNRALKYLASSETLHIDNYDSALQPLPTIELIRKYLEKSYYYWME